MTEYNRTIILTCDSENGTGESNNFISKVPQITIPKGATVSVDGAIVEENSAGSDDVIELDSRNNSKILGSKQWYK